MTLQQARELLGDLPGEPDDPTVRWLLAWLEKHLLEKGEPWLREHAVQVAARWAMMWEF